MTTITDLHLSIPSNSLLDGGAMRTNSITINDITVALNMTFVREFLHAIESTSGYQKIAVHTKTKDELREFCLKQYAIMHPMSHHTLTNYRRPEEYRPFLSHQQSKDFQEFGAAQHCFELFSKQIEREQANYAIMQINALMKKN